MNEREALKVLIEVLNGGARGSERVDARARSERLSTRDG
jgi:hypothetical protein